jgi:hypothetical protein
MWPAARVAWPHDRDLDHRREPPDLPPASARIDEGGLGQVHLARHELHRARVERLLRQEHGRRAAVEGPVGERVHLEERDLPS